VSSSPGGSDDRVERPTLGVSGLERRHLDLDPALPREVGDAPVRLHPENPATSRLELPGRDARATAHVDDVPPGSGSDHPLHQGIGVPGPDPVVPLDVRTERLRNLPVTVRLSLGGAIQAARQP
jgi:hypothetical protein